MSSTIMYKRMAFVVCAAFSGALKKRDNEENGCNTIIYFCYIHFPHCVAFWRAPEIAAKYNDTSTIERDWCATLTMSAYVWSTLLMLFNSSLIWLWMYYVCCLPQSLGLSKSQRVRKMDATKVNPLVTTAIAPQPCGSCRYTILFRVPPKRSTWLG